MRTASTPVAAADEAGIVAAARIIRQGGLVAFPTETVYGLGADAGNAAAIARIFEAKGRPRLNPLIVHVADFAAAEKFCLFDARARKLAAAFWPGPLTLVLPMRDGAPIASLVTAGLKTLAVRVPAHKVAHALIAAAGVPVAAPSANPSGRISPTRAEHVRQALSSLIDLILDGGPTEVGLESTIVACSGGPARLLRLGGLDRTAMEDVLGEELVVEKGGERPVAPGGLASHYAPRAPLRLNVTEVRSGEALLAFGAELPPGADRASSVLNLSDTGDLREAAAHLFDFLHRLDEAAPAAIAVMPIPEDGLGAAINDRLRRASAPRPSDCST
jgi:L-threonylcarbamoyladenylate synthase